ncbi:hypothetical protein S40293_09782 [Stachybotrys chartarum IBT 40293]|nr:hypothetical protein S40293_09782 [Stachybotrys chartarum IBT 40293]
MVEAVGLSLEDVVEVNIFLSDMGGFARINEVYETYWGDIKPTRICVTVKTLAENTDVEISELEVMPFLNHWLRRGVTTASIAFNGRVNSHTDSIVDPSVHALLVDDAAHSYAVDLGGDVRKYLG